MKTSLKIALALVAVTLIAAPLRADFDDVVSAIEHRHHVHHTSIPFLGLARFALHITAVKGVHDFQLATWDEAEKLPDDPGFEQLLLSEAGDGFAPLVRVHEKNGEWTVILARPAAHKRITLLIFAHDHSDTTLVQLEVDPDRFAQELNHPAKMAAVGR